MTDDNQAIVPAVATSLASSPPTNLDARSADPAPAVRVVPVSAEPLIFKGIPFRDDQGYAMPHDTIIEAISETQSMIKVATRDTKWRKGNWAYVRASETMDSVDAARAFFKLPEADAREGANTLGARMFAVWTGSGEVTEDPEW